MTIKLTNSKKVVCSKCGKIWFDWGLRYKKAICDCGQELALSMEIEDDKKRIKNINQGEE
jgi:hypothetical protein